MRSHSSSSTLVVPVVEGRDHLLGPPDAPITLVEYGDFECEDCRAAFPIVHELLEEVGEHVCFVFRHFPLGEIHLHSQHASEAAEAASAQAHFWEMHDRLFEGQDSLEDEDLVTYARQLGLDVARFNNELLSGAHTRHVHDDFMSGVRSGVSSTPTFFINEERYDGPWDLESLLAGLSHAVPPTHRSRSRGRPARRNVR